MPKIPALPPMTSPDAADELPIEDVSANTTKYITLTKLKEWFQALTNFVVTAMITDAAVTWAKIDRTTLPAAGGLIVDTEQSTTSTSFTDLATVQAVTVTVPSSGKVAVHLRCAVRNTGANYGLMGVALSGATTQAANDNLAMFTNIAVDNAFGTTLYMSGLTPGSTTFTAKFRVSGGTGNFGRRQVAVNPIYN